MSFRFEKLEIWQRARLFSVEIYKLTSRFPPEEKFGLIDQLRRASVSIVLNIAEGSDRKSDKEFTRFIRMAISSVEEVVTGLYIACDLGYLNKKDFDLMYDEANLLVSKMNALINSFKKP